jgi:hypothetical protein
MNRLLTGTYQAARPNLVPGLILQCAAVLLLTLYYLEPSARPGFEWVASLKERWGYLYSAITTALCGGFIPWLFVLWRGRTRQHALRDLAFYVVFWAVMGVQVDALYRVQGQFFGNEPSFTVLARKVAVDQFIFAAFWAVPLSAVFYMWKSAGYDWQSVHGKINREFFSLHLPTMVVSAWLIWLPAVSIVYSLPPALQIPIFSLVQCFWSLLVEVLNAGEDQVPSAEEKQRYGTDFVTVGLQGASRSGLLLRRPRRGTRKG